MLKIQTPVLLLVTPRSGTDGAWLVMCSPTSSAWLTHLINYPFSHLVPFSTASLSTTHGLLQSLPLAHLVYSLPWIYALSSLSGKFLLIIHQWQTHKLVTSLLMIHQDTVTSEFLFLVALCSRNGHCSHTNHTTLLLWIPSLLTNFFFFWATMSLKGISVKPSGTATSSLNHWAIFPACQILTTWIPFLWGGT